MKLHPFLAAAALTLACSGSHTPNKIPNNQPHELDVAISSVTLADDCGGGPTASPDEPAGITTEEAVHASQQQAAGNRSMVQAGDRACEQSSIQLRVANGTADASAIAIDKVELLDGSGAVIGELTPRAPSQWGDDRYTDWDGNVAASQTLQVSYALSRPDVQRGATYTVRVTLSAGSDQRTLEKTATLEAEASLPPGAVT